MKSPLRIACALLAALPGACFGYTLSQSVYLVVHPSYMAQWQKWALAHSTLPMPLLLRGNIIQTYQVMGTYETAGLLLGCLIGLMLGFFGLPFFRHWLRQRQTTPQTATNPQPGDEPD